jgi:hypothetical protein
VEFAGLGSSRSRFIKQEKKKKKKKKKKKTHKQKTKTCDAKTKFFLLISFYTLFPFNLSPCLSQESQSVEPLFELGLSGLCLLLQAALAWRLTHKHIFGALGKKHSERPKSDFGLQSVANSNASQRSSLVHSLQISLQQQTVFSNV